MEKEEEEEEDGRPAGWRSSWINDNDNDNEDDGDGDDGDGRKVIIVCGR